MSHNPLDLAGPASIAGPMKTQPLPQDYRLTTTQIGAIGESVVATGLMVASGGRLAPFKPVADDDGIDLLLFDKLTGKAIPLQVKSRTGFDDAAAETVQFDVRRSTFAGRGYAIMALIDGTTIQTLWLIHGNRLADVATRKAGKFVVVASAKAGSKDRYREFRHDGLRSVVQEILRHVSAA